jgi:cellulose synthase operon protein C
MNFDLKRRLGAALCAVSLVALLAACGAKDQESLASQGRAALDKREFAAAAIHLKGALQARPDGVELRVLLGRALLGAGDGSGAVVELSKALEQKARPQDVVPYLAQAILLTGDARRVATQYASVTLDDKNAQALLLTAVSAAHSQLGQADKASAALDRALATAPDLVEARLLQASMTAAAGNQETAIAQVNQALALDPRHVQGWLLKGEFLLTGAKSDPAAAEEAFRKALEVDPRFMQAHAALVSVRLRARDLEGAKTRLAAMQNVAPRHPETRFQDAQVTFLARDYKRSRELVQDLLRLAPENPLLLQLAAANEWNIGSLVIAARHLEAAIASEPSLVQARANLAHLYVSLGQGSRALAVAESAIKAGAANAQLYATAGEAALQTGDVAAAEAYLRKATSAEGDKTRARTNLAMLRLQRGEAGPALVELESLARSSESTVADTALIVARLRRGEHDAALAAIEALDKKEPNGTAAPEYRGRLLAAKQDLAGARAAFVEVLRREPRHFPAVAALADLDSREGALVKARERYEAFLKLEPANHLAHLALADLKQQAGAAPAEVLEHVKAAVQANPKDPTPRLKLVEFHEARKQTNEARAAAEEAAAALPNDLGVIQALGRVQMAAGDSQQALSTLRRIIALDPNATNTHVLIADVHARSGQRGAAVASLRRALEIDPQHRAARVTLVNLLVEDKRPREALDIAADLQKRLPTEAGGYLLEGTVHRRLGNHAAAATAYGNGLRRVPDSAELAHNLYISQFAGRDWKAAEATARAWLERAPNDGRMHYSLGEGYMSNKNYAAAEQHFSKAVQAVPVHAGALNNLAWVLMEQGKPGALPYAERAARAAPQNPAVLDTLASALAQANRMPDALAASQRAVEIAPGDATLRLNLARLAIKSGDKTLARAQLERLNSLAAANPLRDEAQRLLKSL